MVYCPLRVPLETGSEWPNLQNQVGKCLSYDLRRNSWSSGVAWWYSIYSIYWPPQSHLETGSWSISHQNQVLKHSNILNYALRRNSWSLRCRMIVLYIRFVVLSRVPPVPVPDGQVHSIRLCDATVAWIKISNLIYEIWGVACYV